MRETRLRAEAIVDNLKPPHDLVLTGARICDPATGLDRICDLAVDGDRIAAIGAAWPPTRGR